MAELMSISFKAQSQSRVTLPNTDALKIWASLNPIFTRRSRKAPLSAFPLHLTILQCFNIALCLSEINEPQRRTASTR